MTPPRPRSPSPPLLVAVVGGSASGKSTLAHRLAAALAPEAAVVALDRFYRDLRHLPVSRRARVNFDHPSSIDWPLFESTLDTLLQEQAADLPVYDFETHARTDRVETQAPVRVLLLDGLWLPPRAAWRARIALRIFVACPARERLHRRILRDTRDRGRDAAEVRRRWREFVEPGFRRHIAPQARLADVILSSPFPAGAVRMLAGFLRRLAASGACPSGPPFP